MSRGRAFLRRWLLDGVEPDGLVAVDADAVWWRGQPVTDWSAVIAADALGEVEGAFALVWVAGGRIHLARDPIGHRSLFYARDGAGWRVGSTVGAVVSGRPEVDPVALRAWLACAYTPGTRTLLKGVVAVGPGEVVTLGRAGPTRRPFWRLPVGVASVDSAELLTAELRAVLDAAVMRRLPESGAPVGATVSGGIDSSLVAALVHARHDGPLRCFSVSFGPEHADELAWSGLLARHLGADREVVVVGTDDVRAGFDPTCAAMAEPNGDPLTVPNTSLFAAAAAHSPVLFNGEGGDPCFGGPKNAPMLLSSLYDEPGAVDPAEQAAAAWLRAHQRFFDDVDSLLLPEVRASQRDVTALAKAALADPTRPDYLDRIMALNVAWKGAWHILPKVDRLSVASGVWPRSPLFDREVVELAFRIPGPLKRRRAEEKYLLKMAVADLVPDAIVRRPKSGMMVPVEAWFSPDGGPLHAWARERLLDGLAASGLFHPPALERLVGGTLHGLHPRRGVKVWQLLTLESWLRSVGALHPSQEVG